MKKRRLHVEVNLMWAKGKEESCGVSHRVKIIQSTMDKKVSGGYIRHPKFLKYS